MQKHLFCLLLLIGLALPSFSKQIEHFTLNKLNETTVEFVVGDTKVILKDDESIPEGKWYPKYRLYEDQDLKRIYVLQEWRRWSSLHIFNKEENKTVLVSNPDQTISDTVDKLIVHVEQIFGENNNSLRRKRMDIQKVENSQLFFSFILDQGNHIYEITCTLPIDEKGNLSEIESVCFEKLE